MTINVTKPFKIPKRLVWNAYWLVVNNKGAAGVDEQSIADFDRNRNKNLYKIWNRMASGSYFPPAVKAVPIPKKAGGTRILGIPTVGDRIAQTAVKLVLELILDPIFDHDSYGYRPKKSAIDAVAITKQRCWQYDYVVEFDIKGLFDNIDHKLLLKALTKHCDNKWVLLYVKRWLTAPMQYKNGNISNRNLGTPQGGVISSLLANLFLHYTFDAWVRREMPNTPFCRYADDGLLHCKSKTQAEEVMERITQRFKECKLEIHPTKSAIVFCRDSNRLSKMDKTQKVSFNFLGFQFKPRKSLNKKKQIFLSFTPAISKEINYARNQKLAHPVKNG